MYCSRYWRHSSQEDRSIQLSDSRVPSRPSYSTPSQHILDDLSESDELALSQPDSELMFPPGKPGQGYEFRLHMILAKRPRRD